MLSITPFVKHLSDKKQASTEYLKEFYEKNRNKFGSIKVVNIKAISLYKACVDIGLLLNINLKKIRRAYERAIKEIGGIAFECDTVIIMVSD